ncbi:ATP-grasp domain-containing protein [Streptomyces sp. YIM S03343]
MPRVALATFDPAPEPHPDRDLPVLLAALRDAGADAVAVPWDDPDTDWGRFDLVVIRSTWDYTWRAAEFVTWARRTGAVTRLANPAGVVAWNTDKRYLGDLAAAGVPVVPTRYVAPGEELGGEFAEFAEFAGSSGSSGYVVKPTSDAGARHAARYAPGEYERALEHLAWLHGEGLTAMVQPYVTGVDVSGERALQFIGGELLHASRKRAVLAPGTGHDDKKVAHPGLEPWTPTPAELAVAARALAAVPNTPELLYARVDLVTGDDGEPMVMELELVEPDLFLSLHPGSLDKVVTAVLAAASPDGSGTATR